MAAGEVDNGRTELVSQRYLLIGPIVRWLVRDQETHLFEAPGDQCEPVVAPLLWQTGARSAS